MYHNKNIVFFGPKKIALNLTFGFLYIGSICTFLFVSCSSAVMDRNEAERSLKVLNSDIINFIEKTSGSMEFQVLEFFSNQPDSPLPIRKTNDRRVDFSAFNFTENIGEYAWDRDNNRFIRIGESEIIIIHLDDCIAPGITFILSEYLDGYVSSRKKFPMIISSKIMADNEEIWHLNYKGNLQDSMPENITFQSGGKDYSMEGQLKRYREGNEGTLDINFNFSFNGNCLINTCFKSTVGYSLHGYYFKQTEVYQRFSGHFFKGHFDNEKINPTSNNYAASFNRHSRLGLYEQNTVNGKYKKVGDLILAETEHKELLDYHIRFSDGKEVLFGNYVAVFDELMNFKY